MCSDAVGSKDWNALLRADVSHRYFLLLSSGSLMVRADEVAVYRAAEYFGGNARDSGG